MSSCSSRLHPPTSIIRPQERQWPSPWSSMPTTAFSRHHWTSSVRNSSSASCPPFSSSFCLAHDLSVSMNMSTSPWPRPKEASSSLVLALPAAEPDGSGDDPRRRLGSHARRTLPLHPQEVTAPPA